MKKILIVEDDSFINKMICDLLKQNSYEPVPAYSGTEAVLLFNSGEFDLVLLDLMIPGMTGVQVLSDIRVADSVPVIVLTAVAGTESVVSLLKSGANDYISKPFDNNELLARIEVQLRNGTAQRNNSTTYKDIILDHELYDAFIRNTAAHLSKREFEILCLLMQNPKKVFTKNNLYESVWHNEFLGDDNTINVHISKIRSKLATLNPDEDYIQTVWGIGFKMH